MIPEWELVYNYGMQESVINLKKDKKIMSNVVMDGKVWFGAFEDGNEVLCVANFSMPTTEVTESNDWVWKCERIYAATQNVFDSWSLSLEQLNSFYGKHTGKEDGADWIYPKNMKGNRARDGKPIGHRSMSCGDVIQFGVDNQDKKYFGCAGWGFVELTYEEYSKWHDMKSRDRSEFIDDVKKAKQKEHTSKDEKVLVESEVAC